MQKKSYTHGTCSTPLKGETIGENLQRTVAQYGDREALVSLDQGYRATYNELWEQTTLMAKGLMAYGIKRGDRVGIWAPNRYEWVIVQFAAARIGAVLVTVNPAYKITGLRHALEQSKMDMLITASHFQQTDYVDLLNRVRPTCKYPKRTVIIENEWEKLHRAGERISDATLAEREQSLQFDDAINIQYTSGTTGYPKGAVLTHHNILNNAFFTAERMNYTELDRVCIPVPFYHCFGMVLGNIGCTSHGACMVVVGETFRPEAIMKAISSEKCTALFGVPSMFIALLEHPNFSNYDCSTLRTGIMGGSLCPVAVMRQVQSQMNMRHITVCYGMTETSPTSTQSLTADCIEKRVSTVGVVHPHVEIKIVDKNGNIVPRGEEGEVCTRGYSVMKGYWDNPAATAEIIDEQKWLHTGDLARMDDDGYLVITGRIKDIIIRSGESISPKEIEEFIMTHEAVSEVYVIGIPSKVYGEEVMAWVKVRDGYEVTKEQLLKFCRNQIASYKIPRHWKFVDSFPMTVSGKVRKIEMRETAVKDMEK